MRKLLVVLGVLAAASVSASVEEEKVVVLDRGNFVVFRGEVNDTSVSKFISDLINNENERIYIYIDSPGGGVFSGNQAINVMEAVQASGKELICYTEHGYSMGFHLTMACNNHRWGSFSSVLMSHPMSFGVSRGEEKNVENLVRMIRELGVQMNARALRNISLTREEYDKRVESDWWIVGENNLKYNTLTAIKPIICTQDLARSTEVLEFIRFGKKFNVTFSKCPLITTPLKVEAVDGQASDEELADVKDFFSNIFKAPIRN